MDNGKPRAKKCELCERDELMRLLTEMRINMNLDNVAIVELKAEVAELKAQVESLQGRCN